MLKLHKLEDQASIHSVLAKDELYLEMLNRNELEGWNPNTQEAVILVTEGTQEMGALFLQDLTNGYVCLHAGVYKDQRHKQSLRLLKKCTKQLKKILFPLHLCTMAKESNIAANKLIEAAGYKYKTTKSLENINFKLYVE